MAMIYTDESDLLIAADCKGLGNCFMRCSTVCVRTVVPTAALFHPWRVEYLGEVFTTKDTKDTKKFNSPFVPFVVKLYRRIALMFVFTSRGFEVEARKV